MSGVHVHFRIADKRYALPVENVLEVADVGQVAPVPGAPKAVLGVRNLRAQVLPVIDLAVLFKLEHAREGERLLVVEGNGRRAGLVMDEVNDVGELPDDSEEKILDLEAVFAAAEERDAA